MILSHEAIKHIRMSMCRHSNAPRMSANTISKLASNTLQRTQLYQAPFASLLCPFLLSTISLNYAEFLYVSNAVSNENCATVAETEKFHCILPKKEKNKKKIEKSTHKN